MVSKDFLSIRDDLRSLENRVMALHAQFGGNPEWQPLGTIAASIGTFADMLPVYGSFIEFLEKVTVKANGET